ncbi:Uncharacterized conserved protein, DUF58 family, contains vWF domain [Micrococcales bacterium KH10]|nr:Uncharacterized conserved protein, DUF58 family, contains vWF domain [Micrococcales bacterium KH10]
MTDTTDSSIATGAIVGSWRTVRRVVAGTARGFAVLQRSLTSAGWFMVAGATIGPVLTFWLGWAEAAAVGALAIIGLVVAILFVISRRDYEVSLGLLRERVTVGDDSTGSVTVTNAGRRASMPGRVEIPMGDALAVVDVPMLRSGSSHEQELVLPTHRRAVVPVGPVRSVRTDPLQLLRLETTWPGEFVVYVHPKTTAVPMSQAGLIRDLEGHPTRTIADADISFHALREYTAGDPMRNIHWKATAKTGTLMVRQFEETRRSRMAVLLSLRAADYTEEDEFELAVSIAGSLGVSGLRLGREFETVVPEPISEFDTRGLRTIRMLETRTPRVLLDSLSGVDPYQNSPRLVEMAELAAQSLSGLSVAFIVCGAVPSLAELRSSALKFPENVSVVAVVADLGAAPRVIKTSDMTIVTVAVLDDLRHLLLRGEQS